MNWKVWYVKLSMVDICNTLWRWVTTIFFIGVFNIVKTPIFYKKYIINSFFSVLYLIRRRSIFWWNMLSFYNSMVTLVWSYNIVYIFIDLNLPPIKKLQHRTWREGQTTQTIGRDKDNIITSTNMDRHGQDTGWWGLWVYSMVVNDQISRFS